MEPRISVIILNWNGQKWLKNCLSSILSQDLSEDFEVLLVDNGSTDDSVRYVKEKFAEVKVIELSRNYGFAEGNNLGMKHAQGKYLIFVNMDTKALDGWLRTLVKTADKHPEYQILCGIQLPSQEKNRIRTLNAFGNPTPNPHESPSAITDSLFASGACFLIRRKWVHKLVYLFDPYYFCYAEDLELSLRTILLRGRIGYVRDSRIYHFIGAGGIPSFQASKLATRNILLTYYKLFIRDNFLRIFIAQILYIALRFAARPHEKWKTLGMVKGMFDFLQTFHRYKKYRKEFLKKKQRADRYIFNRLLYKTKLEKMLLKRIIYGC